MGIVFPLLSTIVVAAVAAVTDVRTGRIPNWLTLGSLPAGVLLHAALGGSRGGLKGAALGALLALGGALVCGLVPLLFHWFAGMGGGDVKLFMAVGALCGPLVGLQVQSNAYVAFALYVPAHLIYQGRFFAVLGESLGGLRNALRPRRERKPSPAAWKMTVRLGPSILVGVLATTAGVLLHA